MFIYKHACEFNDLQLHAHEFNDLHAREFNDLLIYSVAAAYKT